MIADSIAGAIIFNRRNDDPEWRHQAGTLAYHLEAGGNLSANAMQALRSNVPEMKHAKTKEQFIAALRGVEIVLN